MRITRLILLGLAVGLAGCRSGTLPNPNDPKDVGGITIDNLEDQLSCVSDMLLGREAKGQITDKQFHELMQEEAAKLLKGLDTDKTDVSKLWQVGDVMLTAKEWDRAKPILEAAITWAKENHNDDRWVNDSLRLAHVEAELNKVPEAIKTARSVFAVSPFGAAPILYGVLYDIAPAARGKGHDLELAKLIEDAMVIDLHVRVDTRFEGSREFVKRRPDHLRNAWAFIEKLYDDANRPDLKAQARQRLTEKDRLTMPDPQVRV